MWQLAGAVLLVLLVYGAVRYFSRAGARPSELPKSQPIVHEYWLWTPLDKLPEQPQIQRRLNQGNARAAGRILAVTTGDLLRWWADVRLHIGISLREKNRHIFDPRFFSDEAELPPEADEAMRAAKAVITVRFATEEPMPSRDYLDFMVYLTDALGDLAQSELIYDREAMRFWPALEWKGELMRDYGGHSFQNTVCLHGVEEASGWWLHTHGMRKYGLPDLEMTEVPHEQTTVCTDVLRDLAEQALSDPDVLQDTEMEAYGRTHKLVLFPSDRTGRHHRGLVLNVVDATSIIDQIVYEG